MSIRNEHEKDFEQVFLLNKVAFKSDGEAKLVEKLRHVDGSLSLVSEDNDRIIGHIMFSPVTLNGEATRFVGLAPMAVLPEFQKTGVGRTLIYEGLKRCKAAGHTAVFVLGHIEYYPKFGFVTAASKGFYSIYPVPDDAFMLLELVDGALKEVAGLIEYDEAFGEL